ncbi:MAG: class I SAM-dependent methyltransferase [Nitrospinae bacterium]|nr:class I SAM-dependent methyltransferase [Nitrospinota bacterium]
MQSKIHWPRALTNKIRVLLDDFLPPAVRDSKAVMSVLFWIAFGPRAKTFMSVKAKAYRMTQKEYADLYREPSPFDVKRKTGLNEKSIEKILEHCAGAKVLEAGSGKGYLTELLNKDRRVIATDLALSNRTKASPFFVSNLENLPVKSASFDTVVCTHTLEHLRNLHQAYFELKRVASERLIIVVPMQREYKYTFDLHLHFFPYPHSFQNYLGSFERDADCFECDGDLVYIEYVKKR